MKHDQNENLPSDSSDNQAEGNPTEAHDLTNEAFENPTTPTSKTDGVTRGANEPRASHRSALTGHGTEYGEIDPATLESGSIRDEQRDSLPPDSA
ncbi:MAG: hypothetical protein ACREDR_30880, partial [Blastocatellia bacterium]